METLEKQREKKILTKFKVLIQKQFNHRIKRWIFVDFNDGVFNTNRVETMYPNYQVSMFWPVI